MKISSRTSLREVALAVGQTLADHGIRVVLTGRARASIHGSGAYRSVDERRTKRPTGSPTSREET